jgi:hypothetical protein
MTVFPDSFFFRVSNFWIFFEGIRRMRSKKRDRFARAVGKRLADGDEAAA